MPRKIASKKGSEPKWYASWVENGRRKFRQCPTKDDALLLEIQKRKEVAMGCLTPEVVTLGGLLLNYLKSVEQRGIGKMSIQEKATVFREFATAIGPQRDVRSVTYGEVERYLGSVAQRVSGDRANRHRVHIVAAYSWGVKAMRLPGDNPWAVEKFRIAQKTRYVPPVGDFWRVVDSLPTEQDKRVLMAFLHTSARMSELLALRWQDVDFEGRKLVLRTAKRSGGVESDIIRFTPELEDLLREQRQHVELRSEYVFCRDNGKPLPREYGKELRTWCKVAGVKPFGLHGIRHLSASLMAEAGLPLNAIQARLRHRNATVTSRYVHELMGREDDLSVAFARPKREAPMHEHEGFGKVVGEVVTPSRAKNFS